jgi:hypothetical protein
LGEIEEAGDVVVLFVAGEEAFGFGVAESKGRKADGDTEVAGCGEIAID